MIYPLMYGAIMNNAVNLIIFTPGTNIEHGERLRDQVLRIAARENSVLNVSTWKDNEFFGPDHKYALNECIRKLHSYDGSILILGPQIRPTGDSRRDTFDRMVRFARSLFRLPEQVAPNVLIEIGAVMARFGRNRVFLIEPKSKKVEIPTYFAQNNAHFHSYDDTMQDIEAAMEASAEYIVKEIKNLGDTAYFSDLPSFGLAHGNFNALVKSAIRSIREGDEVTIDGRIARFNDVAFIIPYDKEKIFGQEIVFPILDRIGLVKGEIKSPRRVIAFRTLPPSQLKAVLFIIDVPTNLIPVIHAVEKIEELWLGGATGNVDHQKMLVKKEIENYRRYLDILCKDEELPEDKIRWIPLDDLQSLTLQMIENNAY
jgi:hypothetical protein